MTILKAFLALSMFLHHALYTLVPHIKYGNIPERLTLILAFAHGVVSTTFPAVAGFYLRHYMAPYMEMKKLTKNLLPVLGKIFLWGCLLEGIRNFFPLYDIDHALIWHALHFTCLAAMLCVLVARTDERLIYVLTLLFVLIRPGLDGLTQNLVIKSSDITPQMALIGEWLWKSVVVIILTLFFKMVLRLSVKKVALASVALMGLMFFVPIKSSYTLVSFFNLPRSILLPDHVGKNHWSLLPFFSVFSWGYFLRAFLFDSQKKSHRSLLTVGVAAVVAWSYWKTANYFFVAVDHGIADFRGMYTWDFLPLAGVLGIFYFLFIFSSLLSKHINENGWATKFFQWSNAVLIFYVIHFEILYISFKLFPFLGWVKNFEWLGARIAGVYAFLFVVYFLCVFVSHYIFGFLIDGLGSLRAERA